MLPLAITFVGIVSSVTATFYQYAYTDDGSLNESSYTQTITTGDPIGEKVSASFDPNDPNGEGWIKVGSDTYTFSGPYITADYAEGLFNEGGSGGYDGYSTQVATTWANLDIFSGQLDGDAGWSRDYTMDIIAVPEPGTWAIMLIGFGLMGAMVRQRRRAHEPG